MVVQIHVVRSGARAQRALCAERSPELHPPQRAAVLHGYFRVLSAFKGGWSSDVVTILLSDFISEGDQCVRLCTRVLMIASDFNTPPTRPPAPVV